MKLQAELGLSEFVAQAVDGYMLYDEHIACGGAASKETVSAFPTICAFRPKRGQCGEVVAVVALHTVSFPQAFATFPS